MMRVKSKCMAVLLGLLLCCSLFVGGTALSASAASGEGEGQVAGTNFLQQPVYYVNQDFEDFAEKDYGAEDMAVLYLANGGGTTTSAVASGATAIDGRSLVFSASGASETWGNQIFSMRDSNFAGAMTDDATYYVRLKIKSNAATKLFMNVRNGWGNTSNDFLAEYRQVFSYTDGKITGVTKDTGGWTGADQKYKNETATFTDGTAELYFEFDTTSANTAGCVAIEAFAVYAAGDTIAFDDIQVGKVGQGAAYYTIEHDVDYDSILDKGNVWDNQPIWGNTIDFETESPLSGTASVRLEGSGNNAQIGGFTNNAATEPQKNFYNQAGKYYFQFDIDVQGFSAVNIWTLGDDYWSVQYNDGAFRSEGKASGLRAVDMNTFYRVSFYVTYATEGVAININVTGDGYMLIDNLILAREDYAPYIEDGSVNRVNKQDVTLAVYDKDTAITEIAVKDGDALVAETDYTLSEGVLTLKKELFGTEDMTFMATSSGGTGEFRVTVVDDRTEITQITASAVVQKTYDGTTDASLQDITLTAEGIAEGDTVTVTAQAAFAAADAGETVSVTLSGIELGGLDAYKYKLSDSADYSIAGKITPVQLTVADTQVTLSKVYDATTTAAATIGEVTGVLQDDEAEVTVAAVYNSKNVTEANTITVTYSVNNANYLAPVTETITQGVSITPKAITVTADNKTKTEGDSDPAFTYTADGLLSGDECTGALSREAGESAGTYAIEQGTLTAGDNYTITFTAGTLTVTEAATTEPTPPASPKKGCGSALTGMGLSLGAAVLLLAGALALLVLRRKRSN